MGWKRIIAGAAACALAATCFVAAGCGSSGSNGGSADAGDEPYRIGVVLSLTGTYSGLGTPEKEAIELEVERINAEGGVNGRPVEVYFEDDATDAAKAAAAVVRLIDERKVIAVIGASGTGQTMAMRTELERSGIPSVSMAGGSVITADFSEWVFQTPWPNRLVIPVVLDKMAAAGYTQIAVLSDSGAYGADGHAIIVDSVASSGVTIVSDQVFNPGDTDMTAQLTAIKNSGAETILLWNAGKEAAIAVKNMSQLNMDLPVYGGPGIARDEFITGAGTAAEGVRLVAGKILVPESYGVDTEEYAVATDFIDRYTSRFGSAPDIFAGHAYDAFGVVVDALGRLGDDTSSDALRDAIEATDGWIGVGGVFTYSADDHNGLSEDDLTLYRVEGGTWRLDD